MFVRVYDNKQVEVKHYKVKDICVVVVVLCSVYIFDRECKSMKYVCDLDKYSYIHVESNFIDEFIFITNPTITDLLSIIDKCQFIFINDYMFGHDYFMIKKLTQIKDRKIYRFKVNRWGKTCDIEIK